MEGEAADLFGMTKLSREKECQLIGVHRYGYNLLCAKMYRVASFQRLMTILHPVELGKLLAKIKYLVGANRKNETTTD